MNESILNKFYFLEKMSRFNPVFETEYNAFLTDVNEEKLRCPEDADEYDGLLKRLRPERIDLLPSELKLFCQILPTFKYYDITIDIRKVLSVRSALDNLYNSLQSSLDSETAPKIVLKSMASLREEESEEYWDALAYFTYALMCGKKYGKKGVGKSDIAAYNKELKEALKWETKIIQTKQALFTEAFCIRQYTNDGYEDFTAWLLTTLLDKGLNTEGILAKMSEDGIQFEIEDISMENKVIYNCCKLLEQNGILGMLCFTLDNPACIKYLSVEIRRAMLNKLSCIFEFLTDDIIFTYLLCNTYNRISTNPSIAEQDRVLEEMLSVMEKYSLIPIGVNIDKEYVMQFGKH